MSLCIQDAYGVGNIRPVKDKIQDTNLLGGKEEDGWTIIDFSRKLQTCNEHDITITVRIYCSKQ